MFRRSLSWMLILVLFLPWTVSLGEKGLSVSIASCTVKNRGTVTCGETVTFSIASTGAKRTQLMIVPPDSSRIGMEGPDCTVTLNTPGIWAFVAYAQDSQKNTVHSEQWRITVEGSAPAMSRVLTAEERYINHFFTGDYSEYSEEGKRLKHWLDYREKTNTESRINSGYLLLEEEMVWQDDFGQRIYAGYVSGSELAMNTISNFGINLLLDSINNAQWKAVFPSSGAAAVPYYEMLGEFFCDYLESASSFAEYYNPTIDFILSESGSGAENLLGIVENLPDMLRDSSDAMVQFSKEPSLMYQAAGIIAEQLLTYEMPSSYAPGGYIKQDVNLEYIRLRLEAKFSQLYGSIKYKLQKEAVPLSGKLDEAADAAGPSSQIAKAGSKAAGLANLAMKWTQFGMDLKKYGDRQLLFMCCFMQISDDFLNALQTWRDDESRYGKNIPLNEALDLLIAQILRVSCQELEEYEKGASPEEIAARLSAASFLSATVDTVKFFAMPALEKILEGKPGYGKLMGASAVTGAGYFVLNLMEQSSGYSEWRETVKNIYLIKTSLADSVSLQLEAYRAEPCYSRAVTLIESLNLLKFLKQAGEKTILLDYMGSMFSDLSSSGLSVLLCEVLKDDNEVVVYPQAEFEQIEVVEYRDTHAVADSRPSHSHSRVMGYYSDTPKTFAGRSLSPLPSVYRSYCMETDDPSSMDIIKSIDSTWVTGNQLPNLDLQYISAQHDLIRKNMPGVAQIPFPEADENEAVEIPDYYNPDLFTGDAGYYDELVHGKVYAYRSDSIIITLTPREYDNYVSIERVIRDRLREYEKKQSHSAEETQAHQMEEHWIWMNVTSGFINSVDMFDDWFRKEF